MNGEKRTFVANGEKDTVYYYEDKLKRHKNELPEKQFTQRESLLNVLYENPHVKTIYHIAIALAFGLVLATILRDYVENNEVGLGFRIVIAAFQNIHLAIAAWIFYFSSTLIIYFCFNLWAEGRKKLRPSKSTMKTFWDYFGIFCLFGYYVFSFRLAVYIVHNYNLKQASACFLLMEQTRLIMKTHSFIRSNVPKVLKFKEKSDNHKLTLPGFTHYVFFLFVPTLLYRDEYPRTSTIRWKVAMGYVMELIAILLVYSFTLERFYIPMFKDFGLRKYSYAEICLNIIDLSFSSMIWMLVSFYVILHAVQNFFAEFLRFGDRMFYKDWWTARDFPTFYRKWNVVVHDWLYAYVYKDCYENLVPGNKNVAKYFTFLLSAVIHEFILMHAFGFLYPVMFLEFFCVGTVITHIKVPQNSILNILVWLQIALGASIMMSGFNMEFFARYNGVPPISEDYDFYIPRSLTCDCYK